MLNDERRKYILNEHLENISTISDKEYQKRVWIRGEGPEWNDFDETCCQFFDNGDPILKNYKDYGITENQYYILKSFRDQFRVFSDENDWPQEFIDTQEWHEITEMAKKTLNVFNYKKSRS